MQKICTESLDDLEKGIKQLLSEDRCSLSENEVHLFYECLDLIQLCKRSGDKKWIPNWNHIILIVELLSRFFTAGR